MQKRPFAVPCLAAALATAVAAQEPVDLEVVARIRAEGLERSQAPALFNHLTNVIGPRLTASPAYREAVDWTTARLREWGLARVEAEPWEFGRGWTLEHVSIEMVAPRYERLIGYPRAWSSSTSGRVEGHPVFIGDATAGDLPRLEKDVAGAIVLARPVQTTFVREDRAAPRADWRPGMPAMNNAPAIGVPQSPAGARAQQDLFGRTRPAVILEPTIGEHGTVFVTGTARDARDAAPVVVLASEHYNLVARLVQQGVPVRLAIDVRTRFHEEDTRAFHVLAELPGADPAIGHEVVMVGAHLDSWHTSAGATDNADGVTVAMEAVRILKAIGAAPRRTIRLALWGGEEQGLLGSREYVRRHLAGDANRGAHDAFSVYFNLDNGAGAITGFYLQGNTAAAPIMDAWIRPFHDLGATHNTLQGIGQTDHLSFIDAGLPGFQAIHRYADYDVRTHHTNMDTYERVHEDELRQAAVVMASVLYHAAMRDARLPRAGAP